MSRGVALLVALLLGVGSLGCSAVESLRGQPDARPSDSYLQVLDRWTREAKEYDQLETRVYLSASYKSWPLRQAYVAEYARIYLLSDQEREGMLAREKAEVEQFHDFVASAYAPVRQTADLLPKAGIWRLYLEGPAGVRTAVSSVGPLRQPTEVVSVFYPYVNRWARTYLVRFPRRTPDGREVVPSPDTDPFRLLLASTEARVILTWRP